MKRILAFSLALLLCLSMAACAAKPVTEENEPEALEHSPAQNASVSGEIAETEPTETESPRFVSNVPAADFEGEDFRVGGIEPSLFPSLLLEFDFEEDRADVVESALYNRDRRVEADYNVTILNEYLADYATTRTTLTQCAASGDGSYQLMMLICRDAFPVALAGNTVPWNEIPYLDPSQPWYMKYVNEVMTIKGHQVLLYTDLCMNAHLQSISIVFNKEVQTMNSLEDPYTLVREGRWTHDAFYSMAESVIQDADGDGEYTAKKDVFGILSEEDMFFPSMWVGSNTMLILKDEEDIPVYSAPSDEKLIGILDKLTEKIKINGIFLNSFNHFPGGEAARLPGTQYFTKNGALFRVGSTGFVAQMREMEADFGILPLPKYDEQQEVYYSRMIDGFLHLVPNAPQNLELVGTVFEALSAETKNYVIPAYFHIALTNKFARDTDSEEMLNIVFDNINVDLGDTILYEQLRYPLTLRILALIGDYESFLTKREKIVNSSIKDFLKAVGN